MAYNSQSYALTGALGPNTNYGQGYAYSGGFPSWEASKQPASTPSSFTGTYGTNENGIPRDTNIDKYWTGTGYGEIGNDPLYQPYDYTNTYDVGNYPTTDWQYANTYAPWAGYGPGGNESTPGELSQLTNLNNQYRESSGYNTGMGLAGFGAGSLGASALLGGPVMATGGLLAGLFGMNKKKRSSPEFNAPSYQGMMFTPEEGFPAYYSPSQEGASSNMTSQDVYSGTNQYDTQSQMYDYNYTGGAQSGSLGAPANYDPEQNYVGQQDQAYGSFYDQNRGGIFETFTV